MSECVVRMEIPKNCWVCPFGLDGYIWNENDARTHHVRFCSRHSDEEYHVLEIDTIDRPWFCDSFICQLPEGHGRLIDADELFHNMFVTEDGNVVPNMDCDGRHHLSMHVEDVKRYICEAPTIVPADAPDAVTPTDTPTDTPTVPAERSDT